MENKTIFLPTDIRCNERYNGETCLQAMGVRLRYDPPDENVWKVKLPEGWKIVPIDGTPQWSWLLDNQGRQRGRIYRGLKIYDTSYYMELLTKFRIQYNYDQVIAEVVDSGRTVWTSGEVYSYSSKKNALDAAEKWLDDRYPDWRNPAAYWD